MQQFTPPKAQQRHLSGHEFLQRIHQSQYYTNMQQFTPPKAQQRHLSGHEFLQRIHQIIQTKLFV